MKKRVISFILALAMVCSLLPGATIGAAAAEADSYTYKTYTAMLAENWNPHSWSSDDDSAILDLLTTPLVEMAVADSENGVYQWAYLAAESITDVTAQHQDDLDKYGSTGGNVFEIALNPDMKWQDGTPINADTYVYSMERLLNPGLQNPRANTYFSGEAAIAGAYNYFHSNMEGYYVPYTNVYGSLADAVADTQVYLDLWYVWGAEGYIDAQGNTCPQYVSITDETVYSADGEGSDAISGVDLYLGYTDYFEVGGSLTQYAVIYQANPNMGVSYDTVGLYKVDDYTIRYVTQNAIDINYLRYSLTSNWLVYEDLYETGSYGTGMANTMSYGPYQLSQLSATQMILTQNPNHYEYTVNSDGSLSSVTEFLVDGQQVSQWQAQTYVITVMDSDAAKVAFLNGQLDDWTPGSTDLAALGASERLYKADKTFSMSFFMNTNQSALKEMDNNAESGNQNSAVLSNDNFRKAFSLAIDRSDWVTVTEGYKPAYGLMNNLYYYDIYNDPSSSYRYSKQAMAAMCDLYGVSYTDETLADAYASITGYDLAQAKALMAQACDELVEASLYTEGEDITIHVAYTSATVSASHEAQIAKLNGYLNAAAEGSGFGTITLVADGETNPYGAISDGTHAIGYGGWGGAAFYPFRYMQIYCAPSIYDINEGHCWDPATEELTLTVNGEEVTMTWQEWSFSCTDGAYRDADFDTKLTITAALETGFLAKYYRIPLGYSSSCTMLSPKVDYYTNNYNAMYGFGGLRLMQFHYTDSQWDAYVASGKLDYGWTDLPVEPTEPPATEPVDPSEPPATEPTEPIAPPVLTGDYTYDTSMEVLPQNWNPHTWETSNDETMLQLLTTPLVDVSVADSEKSIYQWIYLAAESVTDVTAQHQDDLEKYGSDGGNVFEIALNPAMKWQDGTPINADSYLYSMEKLLNSDLQNSRAADHTDFLAGATGYYFSGKSASFENYTHSGCTFNSLDELVLNEDGTYTAPNGAYVYIPLKEALTWFNGSTFQDYVDAYGSDFFDVDAYAALAALADDAGNVTLTTESAALLLATISTPSWGEGPGYEVNYIKYLQTYPVVDFDTVGLYKVDDYTIRYVTQNAAAMSTMLMKLTDNWLVYPALYETGSYGTNVDNTMSYGPYQLSSVSGEQIVLTQNPNHFEYTAASNGTLSSTTSFLVDGQHVAQWQAQNYVIHCMDSGEAGSAFLEGRLDYWTPDRDAIITYRNSDRMYRALSSTFFDLFFNTDLETLRALDSADASPNVNSVVLSNNTFREAFSLAMDREDWTAVHPGYAASFTLMNDIFFYDLHNDPSSRYRDSKQAMAAMCDLYGVSYTEDTLEESYASITGYDLPKAKALMAQACDELVSAGLYAAGEDITIQMAYSWGTLNDSHMAQIARLNAYLNAAAEGSGFGTITLVGAGNAPAYDVSKGSYAIGFGGWSGSATNPFGFMAVYLDPSYIAESGCWDPSTEQLTIELNGESLTKSYTDWQFACDYGEYADADFDTRLTILATLEKEFLAKHYRIPMISSCDSTMLSYQVDAYADRHNLMYGFGGLRLMKFNYTDAQWADYIASGQLDYGGISQPDIPDVEGDPTAEFTGHSLSLNGDIGVNFYTALNDAFLADPNAHIEFTVNGITQGYGMDMGQLYIDGEGNERYRFSYNVAAKEMADEITAQMYVSDGSVGDPVVYSVASYYDAISQQFSREEKPELFAMVEAMLNYGAAAQEYFGYNTDDLANAAVSAAVPENVDASAYAATVTGSDLQLSYAGMSLVLESNTALRVFFRATNGADLSNYVFTVNGQPVTPVEKAGLWYIELTDIAAKDLDTTYCFTAGDVTVQCSALSYVHNVLQKADALDAKLVSLCKALFAYSQTADAYFAAKN